MNFLIDHNLKGQAILLWGTLAAEGWLEIMPIRFVVLEEVGLSKDSSDRTPCCKYQIFTREQGLSPLKGRDKDAIRHRLRHEPDIFFRFIPFHGMGIRPFLFPIPPSPLPFFCEMFVQIAIALDT